MEDVQVRSQSLDARNRQVKNDKKKHINPEMLSEKSRAAPGSKAKRQQHLTLDSGVIMMGINGNNNYALPGRKAFLLYNTR